MPQPNNIVDPIILAAMVEDPDETEEEKKMREELLGTTETTPGKGTPSSDEDDDDSEDEDDDDKAEKPKPKSDDENADEDEDDSEEDKPDPKKPVEAQDDEEDEDDDKPDDKKTRKERRQEKREDFLASIRKDNVRNVDRPDLPNYQPIDYSKEPLDQDGNPREYKPEELVQDREMVGAVQFARGAQEASYWAEQDKFWSELGTEAKITAYDPDLKFLAETLPNGKPNPDFDPDKTEEINARYLQMAGFKQFYKTDKNGTPLVNRRTGQPIIINTVQRTDLSYEKFARSEVNRMKRWAEDFAEDRVEETKNNITKQRKNQGIRPNGGKRKTLGNLNLGDISRMSDEELEKNEAQIDAQIDAMLGL